VGLKSKIAGFLAAAVVAIGIAAPALADDDADVSFEILEGDELSVQILHASNFTAVDFNLLQTINWNAGNGSVDLKVTDLRGTGAGWSVKASSTGFFSDLDDDPIEGSTLGVSNNTAWATGPYTPASASGFSAEAGSNSTGVTAPATSNSSILGSGQTILTAAPGITNSYPHGSGYFHQQDVFYLSFPAGIAAGTYSATVLLTISSGDSV
jgi:hypothetical protein